MGACCVRLTRSETVFQTGTDRMTAQMRCGSSERLSGAPRYSRAGVACPCSPVTSLFHLRDGWRRFIATRAHPPRPLPPGKLIILVPTFAGDAEQNLRMPAQVEADPPLCLSVACQQQ